MTKSRIPNPESLAAGSRLVIVHCSLVIAVMFLAAWLRFSHLDQVEFTWDQAEISKWALNTAHGHFTWIGPISSTGLDTFPFAVWLMAIPYALSHSPVFATGFVALLNTLTVIGGYFLARRWFGREAALVSTLLFAVAPWAVIYSRKIWHTALLPPLVLPYVVTGWYAFVRGRRWAVIAHILSLVALIQTHFSTFPFIPLTILWAIVFRKRLAWRVVPPGILLAALAFVPYLVVDAQRDWRNVQRFLEIVQRPAVMSADAAVGVWTITTGQALRWLTGAERYPEFVAATPNIRWLFPVEGVLALTGGLLALWRAVRQARTGLDDETAAALMAATWLAAPVVFLTRGAAAPAPHYFTTTLPAQFLLVGWLGSWVVRWASAGSARRLGNWVKVALAALVVVLAAAQVYEVTALLRFVTTHDVPGYGTPVRYEIQAVETATRLGEENGGAEVVLLSEGDEPRMYEMPNVADTLLVGRPHRAVDVRTALVFPAAPAVYWATYDETPGEAFLAVLTPEVTEARIPLREGAGSFRFYRWPGGEPLLPGFRPLPGGPRTWANGAQLAGFIVEGDPRPGGTIRWTLLWRPTRTPTEDVWYHWFNHLLDGQGQLLGQQDGPSLLPAYWREGDTILNWFDITIPPDAPPGDYTMRVGMYTFPALQNVPVLDAGGVPLVELEIPLPRERD